MNVAMFDMDVCTHRLQALDVQIHRARTDRAAAGERHARLAETGYQWPEHQYRCTHGLYHVVGRFQLVDLCAAQGQCALFDDSRNAHLHQQVAHGSNVMQIRQVIQMQFIRSQQACAHDW